MPLGFPKQGHGDESIWCEVAGLIADDDFRHHDPFGSREEFEVKGKRYQEEFASDLAKILNKFQTGNEFSSMLVEEIVPFEDKGHVSKSRRTAVDSQAFLYETYDIHGEIESVELEIDNSDSPLFPESDSDIASPLSLSSPQSPPSPPVEIEFELDTMSSTSWETDLFGQVLPSALAKAETTLDSISSLSEDPSSSPLDLASALLATVESSSSSSSSSASSSSLPSNDSKLSQEALSPKSKRKQPPPRAPQRPRTVRRKVGASSEESVAVILSDPESSPSESSSALASTPQKRKQSPTKRRVSSQHNKIFETEEVLKLSTKANHEEEQEDVDID
jgi:hypothetical protein